MTLRHAGPPRSVPRLGAVVGSLAALALTTTACQAGVRDDADGGAPSRTDGAAEDAGGGDAPQVVEPEVSTRPAAGATDVGVDTLVTVAASRGVLSTVRVTSPTGQVAGGLRADDTRWRATDRLEPGTTYEVLAVAETADGGTARARSSFTTADLSLDDQTYPSIAPLAGETVGVGMPVVVAFDLPVADRAEFERHMSVTSVPRQRGTWRWFSDTEVRWRPASYWEPGTQVSVDVDVNGLDAGNGIYGQEDRTIDFTVGDAHVYEVDARTHQMRVFSNGSLLRTLPITTGKAGFITRSGTKVVMEKFESRRMNSETIGIDPASAEGYDLDDVEYAMRLTYSGEFIHAAPWSESQQGSANVSHGCTGMSTDDARWLYDLTRRGDVVEYTGTDRPMTLANGYGDWNAPFSQYRRASAL